MSNRRKDAVLQEPPGERAPRTPPHTQELREHWHLGSQPRSSRRRGEVPQMGKWRKGLSGGLHTGKAGPRGHPTSREVTC